MKTAFHPAERHYNSVTLETKVHLIVKSATFNMTGRYATGQPILQLYHMLKAHKYAGARTAG